MGRVGWCLDLNWLPGIRDVERTIPVSIELQLQLG